MTEKDEVVRRQRAWERQEAEEHCLPELMEQRLYHRWQRQEEQQKMDWRRCQQLLDDTEGTTFTNQTQ